MNINESLPSNKIAEFFLLVGLFSIPIYVQISHWFFLIALPFSIITAIKQKQNLLITINKLPKPAKLLIYSIVIYFLISLLGLSYTSDIKSGLSLVELKFTFIYVILIFLMLIPKKKLHSKFIKVFLFGTLLNALTCYIIAFYKSGYGFNNDYFTYTELAYHNHPSYLSFYNTVAVIILNHKFLTNWKLGKNKIALASILASLFSVSFIILLSSKAGITTWLIIMFLAFIFDVIHQKQHTAGLTLLTSSLLLFIIIYNNNTIVSKRFKIFVNTVENYEPDLLDPESTSSRIDLWKRSYTLIKEKPLFGYGTGSVTNELHKLNTNQDQKPLNAHNQFINDFVENGLLGLLSLLSVLIFFFLIIRKNLFWSISISLAIGINFLVESMFSRLAGVIFIAVIFGLAINYGRSRTKRTL